LDYFDSIVPLYDALYWADRITAFD
jgi:hypothetical protein